MLANKIRINTSKTKYILYSYRKKITFERPIKIGNEIISQTDSTKFLGIQLDENLCFKGHVNGISIKISRGVGIIYKLQDHLPMEILCSLYYSLVHPYIIYALIAWYNSPKYNRNKIIILQKRAVRAVNSLYYNDHTAPYFKHLKLLPLDFQYKFDVARYMYRTLKHNSYDVNLLQRLVVLQDIHSYGTRSNDNLPIPRYKKENTKRCLHFQGVNIWNSIPPEIKESGTFREFKTKMMSLLVDAV